MDTIMLIVINLSTAVLCLILGYIVLKGKADILLGTYTMMSTEEQEKWNVCALRKFTVWIGFTFSIVLFIGCVPILLNFHSIVSMFLTWGVFSIIGIWGMIFRVKSHRFKTMTNIHYLTIQLSYTKLKL